MEKEEREREKLGGWRERGELGIREFRGIVRYLGLYSDLDLGITVCTELCVSCGKN